MKSLSSVELYLSDVKKVEINFYFIKSLNFKESISSEYNLDDKLYFEIENTEYVEIEIRENDKSRLYHNQQDDFEILTITDLFKTLEDNKIMNIALRFNDYSIKRLKPLQGKVTQTTTSNDEIIKLVIKNN